ncbi:MAG TPA: hypothetical protein VFY45_13015 [Baekduia sp.]|nr:hypothetical protein [Baekduia sp.]
MSSTVGQQDLPSLTSEQQRYAIKTWRYLRLAMIALVIGLFTAVTYEIVRRGGHCWQTSISAYYYTHAQAIFVGTLIAIGTCLVCLRGSTELEDVLLNVAGMLAPVVALVPTPKVGACASLPGVPEDPTPNIENNVTALLVVGLVAFLLLAALSWRRHQPTAARIGYGLAFALWLGGGLWFLTSRPAFVAHAHDRAAYTMFGCMIAVAVVNAVGFKHKQNDPNARNRYSAVAIAMISVPVLAVFGGKYRVLAAEIDAIVLFAIFWAIQTEELWGEGVREPDTSLGNA